MFKEHLNKTIENVVLVDDNLYINFTNGTALRIWDQAQVCCERRYMSCNYKLESFQGATLLDIQFNHSEFINFDKVMSIEFTTSKGKFTVENHIDHDEFKFRFNLISEETKAWTPKL